MRPTRWFNQTLPQTLQIAVFLLYFTGAFGVLGRMHVTNSYTPYLLLGLKVFNSDGPATLLEFAASIGFILAGLFLANERKRAWVAAVGLAAGAVVIPVVVASGFSFLSSDYIITWMFDVALLALLLHPMSRNHQRVWFS